MVPSVEPTEPEFVIEGGHRPCHGLGEHPGNTKAKAEHDMDTDER